MYYHPDDDTKIIAHVEGGAWYEVDDRSFGWSFRRIMVRTPAAISLERILTDELHYRLTTGTP